MTCNPIHTGGKEINLKFVVQIFKKVNLLATAYSIITDSRGQMYRGKSCFFNQVYAFDQPGTYELEFPMPVTPEKLTISFQDYNRNDETAFKIVSVSSDYLPKADVWMDPVEQEYYNFIKDICRDLNDLKPNEHFPYTSDKGHFRVFLKNQLLSDDGNGNLIAEATPARTDHNSGMHEVNANKIKDITVPGLMVIFQHERKHYKDDLPKESHTPREAEEAEIACDLEALRVCLGMGFPKEECVNVFASILTAPTDVNRRRLAKINEYANAFKYNKQQQAA